MKWYFCNSNDELNYQVHNIKKRHQQQWKTVDCNEYDNLDQIIDLVCADSLFGDSFSFLVINSESLFKNINEKQINQLKNSHNNISIFYLTKRAKSFDFDKLDKNDYEIIEETTASQKIANVLNVDIFSSEEDKNYFYNNIDNSSFLIENEVEKLLTYANDCKINLSEIQSLMINNVEEDIFHITNYLLNKDLENTIKMFEKLMLKITPIELIPLFSKKLFELKLIKQMNKSGISNADICKCFGKTSYVLSTYIIPKLYIYNFSQLLDELKNIDYNIKVNKYNPYHTLKLFFLKNV